MNQQGHHQSGSRKRIDRAQVSLRSLNLDVETPDGRIVDARELDYTDLLYVRLAVEDDVNAIKVQIGAAKAKVYTEGEYADPQWYQRANTALLVKKRQLQIVQTMIGQKRREKIDSIERIFVDICRERMEPDLFEKLMRRTQDIHDFRVSAPTTD